MYQHKINARAAESLDTRSTDAPRQKEVNAGLGLTKQNSNIVYQYNMYD